VVSSATITAHSRIGLLERKIESMTAAKRHKDDVNCSKMSGQPGSMYVATARKSHTGSRGQGTG
jgi:hypothetical protein